MIAHDLRVIAHDLRVIAQHQAAKAVGQGFGDRHRARPPPTRGSRLPTPVEKLYTPTRLFDKQKQRFVGRMPDASLVNPEKKRFVGRMPDASLVNPEKKLFLTREEAEAWVDQKVKDRANNIQITGIPTPGEWLIH